MASHLVYSYTKMCSYRNGQEISSYTFRFLSLCLSPVSYRTSTLGKIPMETELTYFLEEYLDYFSENDFMRHGFCELSFSPKDDNKPG